MVDNAGLLRGVVGRRELEMAGAVPALSLDLVRTEASPCSPISLDAALLTLGRHSVRQAPVVGRHAPDRLVGMLSLEDIAAAVERSHG